MLLMVLLVNVKLLIHVRELDVHIMDVNNDYGGCCSLGGVMFCTAGGGLGNEGVIEGIGLKLGNTYPVFDNIVGDAMITCVSINLNKIPSVNNINYLEVLVLVVSLLKLISLVQQ